jgi:hypothetical protein
MAREGKVITGALIEISVRPRLPGATVSTIGRAMALNIQEQYRVMPVYGIGNLTPQELPVLQYAGAFSVQQFGVSRTAIENLMGQFKKTGAPGMESKEKFVRQLLFGEGVDVTVYRREKQGNQEVKVPLASITGAVCTSESMSIQENQIVVRNGEFVFADPVSILGA